MLAQSGGWNALGFAAYAAVMFVLSPFIVERLGLEAYGVWELVVALTGYLSFADLGVAPAIVHHVARAQGAGDRDALLRWVNSALVAFSASACVVLLAGGVLAHGLDRWLDVAPGFASEARTALVITAGYVAVTMPLNAFSAVLVGRLRYDLLVSADLASLAVRTALIVVLLSGGHGLIALAAANAGTRLLEMGTKAFLAFRVEPGLRLAPRLATREHLRGLVGFGGIAILIAIALQLTWATDAVVIQATLGSAAVGAFAVGSKLALYARDFFRVAGRAFEPAAASLDASGEREHLSRLLARASRWVLLLAGPAIVYLCIMGPAFLERWMGDATFRGDPATVLLVMALGLAAPIAAYPYLASMYGLRMLRPLAALVLSEGIVNLVASIALAPHLGIVGVALGTAVPAAIVHFAVLPAVVCRRLRTSWRTAAVGAWAPALLAAATTAPLLALAGRPEASHGWASLVALALGTAATYGGLWWLAARVVPLERERTP
jgi:O-antigen/teichoic acid export membrane protein